MLIFQGVPHSSNYLPFFLQSSNKKHWRLGPYHGSFWSYTFFFSKKTSHLFSLQVFDAPLIYSGWRFQPIWKICSSNWIIFPSRGENKKSLKPPPSIQFFMNKYEQYGSPPFFPNWTKRISALISLWTKFDVNQKWKSVLHRWDCYYGQSHPLSSPTL